MVPKVRWISFVEACKSPQPEAFMRRWSNCEPCKAFANILPRTTRPAEGGKRMRVLVLTSVRLGPALVYAIGAVFAGSMLLLAMYPSRRLLGRCT